METSVNNKCRAFTSLEQSRKLAEILPLDSADMRYGYISPYDFSDRMYGGGYDKVPYPKDFLKLCADFCEEDIYDGSLPCWSLSALLGVLESEIDGEEGETYQLNIEKDGTWWNVWYREQYDEANPIETESTEDLIDACYEMIIRLNELKML